MVARLTEADEAQREPAEERPDRIERQHFVGLRGSKWLIGGLPNLRAP